MKKLDVGIIVVCTNSPQFSQLVGAVGEIISVYTPTDSMALIGSMLGVALPNWKVHFPGQGGAICRSCANSHCINGIYPMASSELKPLDDPDQGVVEETEETEPVGFGFITA